MNVLEDSLVQLAGQLTLIGEAMREQADKRDDAWLERLGLALQDIGIEMGFRLEDTVVGQYRPPQSSERKFLAWCVTQYDPSVSEQATAAGCVGALEKRARGMQHEPALFHEAHAEFHRAMTAS